MNKLTTRRLGMSVLLLMVLVVPFVASAQLTNIENIVDSLDGIVDAAVPVAAGIALLAFFWGLAKFIFSAGNEEARKAGKSIMLWGIIALFVIVSIWGITNFIATAFDLDVDSTADIPEFS